MDFCVGVRCKDKNRTAEIAARCPEAGDVWLWVGMDADSKLVLSWALGDRSADTADRFIADLASRLRNRVQITTDGHRAYLDAIENSFGADVDYAMLIKMFGPTPVGEHRYSPPQCIAAVGQRIEGNPDAQHVSTRAPDFQVESKGFR